MIKISKLIEPEPYEIKNITAIRMLRLLLESGFTELRVEIKHQFNVNDKPVYTRDTKIYKEETKTYYDACFLDVLEKLPQGVYNIKELVSPFKTPGNNHICSSSGTSDKLRIDGAVYQRIDGYASHDINDIPTLESPFWDHNKPRPDFGSGGKAIINKTKI